MLSNTVSKALTFTFGEEARETAKFVDLMDKFFDSFNVSSFDQGRKARKPFQKPYHKAKSEDEDFRLQVHKAIEDMKLCTIFPFVSFFGNFLLT